MSSLISCTCGEAGLAARCCSRLKRETRELLVRCGRRVGWLVRLSSDRMRFHCRPCLVTAASKYASSSAENGTEVARRRDFLGGRAGRAAATRQITAEYPSQRTLTHQVPGRLLAHHGAAHRASRTVPSTASYWKLNRARPCM